MLQFSQFQVSVSLWVLLGLLSLQVPVLWPVSHLCVHVEVPERRFDHLCWVDSGRGLFEDLVDEGVELGQVRDALVSSVELLEVESLDDGPDRFLGVGFAGVCWLEEDLVVVVHLEHVLVRLVGPVVVEDQYWFAS